MKTRKWTEKLFKSSSPKSSPPLLLSTAPSSLSSTPITPSSSQQHLLPSPPISPPISPTSPVKKKSIFAFGGRNDSVQSLLSLAFNPASNETEPPKHARSHTPTLVSGKTRAPKTDAAATSGVEEEEKIVTTTLYYHPPEPEKQSTDEAYCVHLNPPVKKLNQQKTKIGHLSKARATDQGIPRSGISPLKSPHLDHGPGCPFYLPGVRSSSIGSSALSEPKGFTRARSGSVPSTSPAAFYSEPPKPRPHEIASLPEQYVQYLQQQQRCEQLLQSPLLPSPPKDKLRRHSSDAIMKLRASIASMIRSGSPLALSPSFRHEAYTLRGPLAMPMDLPCPYNTPVVSGTIQVYSCTDPPSTPVGRLKDKPFVHERDASNVLFAREMTPKYQSYEELLKAVDSLNTTVEILSRKIVTMMNVPNTAPSRPRRGSLREEGFSSGSSNLSSPAGSSLTPPTTNLLSAWTVQPSLSSSSTISLSHCLASGSQKPSGMDITLVVQPPPTWQAENSNEAAVFTNKLNVIERNNNHCTARRSPEALAPPPGQTVNRQPSPRKSSYSPSSSVVTLLPRSQPFQPPPRPLPPIPTTSTPAAPPSHIRPSPHIRANLQLAGIVDETCGGKLPTGESGVHPLAPQISQEGNSRQQVPMAGRVHTSNIRRASLPHFLSTAPDRRHSYHGAKAASEQTARHYDQRYLSRALTAPCTRLMIPNKLSPSSKSSIVRAIRSLGNGCQPKPSSHFSTSLLTSSAKNSVTLDLKIHASNYRSRRPRNPRVSPIPQHPPPPPRPLRSSEDLCQSLALIGAQLATLEFDWPQLFTGTKTEKRKNRDSASPLGMASAERQNTMRISLGNELQAIMEQLQSGLQLDLQHQQEQGGERKYPQPQQQPLQQKRGPFRARCESNGATMAMGSIAKGTEYISESSEKGSNVHSTENGGGNLRQDVGPTEEKLLQGCGAQTKQLMSELEEIRGRILQYGSKEQNIGTITPYNA